VQEVLNVEGLREMAAVANVRIRGISRGRLYVVAELFRRKQERNGKRRTIVE